MKSFTKAVIGAAIAIFVVAVVSATYEHFFSDKTKVIKVLQQQIDQQEKRIAGLTRCYGQLQQEDEQRLAEITLIKAKLTTLRDSIKNHEVNLAKLKNSVIAIDTALDVIAAHARDAVAGGRDVEPACQGAGTREAGLDPER